MPSQYFNTSHVTVYLHVNSPFNKKRIFQYISCYCLSVIHERFSIFAFDFNTSHVTVYLVANWLANWLLIFQYISCYCLSLAHCFRKFCQGNFNTSHVTVYLVPVHTCSSNQSISIHLMLLFIRKIEFIPIGFKHFNTSHVTVYRSTIYINVTIYTDFNTSHVTVYHHKLLPFCPIFSFQYISCYCLSVQVYAVLFPFFYFNTSHVTVYQTPMRLKRLKVRYFNTSHVTVYL